MVRRKLSRGKYSLKKLKKIINESCAHSNAIYAFHNFDIAKKLRRIELPFFDKNDIDLVKTDLWFIGNTAMGLMDLLYGVNTNHNLITFCPDFVKRLKAYEATGEKLKVELMKKERFSKFK